jgi:non-specific serine/threonine protein kinase
VLRHYLTSGAYDRFLRLAAAVWRFWWGHGYLSEGRRWLAAGLASQAGLSAARVTALTAAGVLATEQAEFAEARPLLDEALDLARELGSLPALELVHTARAVLALGQNDGAQAHAEFSAALRICRVLGDQQGVGTRTLNLGVVALQAGDYAAADALFNAGFNTLRDLGNSYALAACISHFGILAYDRGDLAKARASFAECMVMFQELGHRDGIAQLQIMCGHVARRVGDFAGAERLYAAGLVTEHELGIRQRIADGLRGLALLAADRGQLERAAALIGAAEGLSVSGITWMSPFARAEFEAAEATTRRQLGERAYVAAAAAGKALTLPQAVTFAISAETRSDLAPSGRAAAARHGEAYDPLTDRERTVLRLIAAGRSNKEIGLDLNVSVRTVERHIANLYAKLNVHSRAQAIAYALQPTDPRHRLD